MNLILKKHLPRRSFLRGMGGVVALPFLDAMIPALGRGAATKAPARMAVVYFPNGVQVDSWYLQADSDVITLPGKLPRTLEPLEMYREDISVMGGLTVNGGRALGDGPGDHGRAGASYLTGAHPKKTFGKDLEAGISMDQYAAKVIGGATRFASLELGCEEGIQGGNCDNGYSCAYSTQHLLAVAFVSDASGSAAARSFRAPLWQRRGGARPGGPRPAGKIPNERARFRTGRCQAAGRRAGRQRSQEDGRVHVRGSRH
jgi:hypothetical protein